MARHTAPDVIERVEPQPVSSSRPLLVSLALSLRPSQWTKNLFVFAALMFGQRLFEPTAVAQAVAAFVIFCALSGVVYLINDVADREADRRHPVKMHRPVASGAVSVPLAIGTAAIIAALALLAAFWLRPQFGLVAVSYLGAADPVFLAPEACRHHRRADDRDWLRAARCRGRGRDRRPRQPLDVHPDDAAGAVPGAEQAAARAGAAGRRRHRAPQDPRGVQPVPARPDDRRW